MLLQHVLAYDSQVQADLKYSRDALLKQRAEIEAACDSRLSQIAQLEQEIVRLRAYLKDIDRALQNIDHALKGH